MREQRFIAMADALEARWGTKFTALDLGCGPGSLSARMLDRFPGAHMVGIDYDPVLLHLGRNAYGRCGGRMAWVEADLRRPSWIEKLPGIRYHAAVSTTAIHWLPQSRTRALYRELRGLLRPGGLLLNGEHLPFDPALPRLGRIADGASHLLRARSHSQQKALGWREWWASLKRVPELGPLFRIREERYPDADHHEHAATAADHIAWMRAAGFRESGLLWQHMDDFIIAGLR
jgi:SAM-dependent methyltransferase